MSTAGGYLLIAVPNVEAFTLFLFVAGYTLGVRRGAAAAAVAAVLYFGFNPQGGFFPPLFIAQLIGVLAAPTAGAALRKVEFKRTTGRVVLATTAIIITLWFDLLTNLAFPITAGFDRSGTFAILIAGIPFALIHIGSNAILFPLTIPPLLEISKRYALSEW